jgi:hypothetical protein
MVTSTWIKLIFLAEASALASAYLVDPPTFAAADTIKDCSAWHIAVTGDTCELIAENNWITAKQFQSYVCLVEMIEYRIRAYYYRIRPLLLYASSLLVILIAPSDTTGFR